MRQRRLTRRAAGLIAGLLSAAAPAVSAGAQGETVVHLRAVARDGGPVLTDGVRFEVWAREGERAVRKVAEASPAPATLELPTAAYRVVATYRQARTVIDIAVPTDAPVRETVSLDVGQLKLELLPAAGAAPVRRDVAWTVRPYRAGGGRADALVRTRTPVPQLGLSAGWYKVAAQHGEQTYTHVVEVAAGRSVTYSLFAK
jgi:hypothetical protein